MDKLTEEALPDSLKGIENVKTTFQQTVKRMMVPEMKSILNSNPSDILTKIKYPGLNHLFQHCSTGLSNEYGNTEETISPDALSDIVSWIKNRTMSNSTPMQLSFRKRERYVCLSICHTYL